LPHAGGFAGATPMNKEVVMSQRVPRHLGLFVVLGCAGILVLVGLSGCTGESKTSEPEKPVVQTKTDAAPPPAKIIAAQPVSRQRRKAFKQAVLLDPPEGQQRPPDLTFAGKNVARIFEAVAGMGNEGGLWDQVELADAQGRLLKYTGIVRTDVGEIHIALLPEAAPNHVTSFIALARAGYYDGLPFHISQRSKAGEKPLGYLEAGCPKGTGEQGYGSVGYWLEPEIDTELVHESGMVGAWHLGDEADTDAARFYIMLHPAPWMDGSYTMFGRVIRGLDVADAINRRPVIDEEPFDRPKEPVLIRQVVIESQ
jgi:peptidyl-prolyl cis-trans isomerase B (cyclophilin B)